MTSIKELIPVLQTAIRPVILISGVGLLLLSMTNRLSRVIDRASSLLAVSESQAGPTKQKTLAQIDILRSQARLNRLSILFAAVSLLCAALPIIILFVTALFGTEDAQLLSIIFVACMGSLIASLIVFLIDINRSLSAVKVELYGYETKPNRKIDSFQDFVDLAHFQPKLSYHAYKFILTKFRRWMYRENRNFRRAKQIYSWFIPFRIKDIFVLKFFLST